MARTKTFNPQQALEAAVGVFWERGYEAASLDTLMNGMGVARQSVYDTFGDKRVLYLRALASYRDAQQAQLRRLFAAGRPVRAGFAKLLNGLCGEPLPSLQRGCLLLSANLERAAKDEEVAALLRQNLKDIESIFAGAIKAGIERGELAPQLEPRALARFFVSTLQGMRATARVQPDRKALRQIARTALSVLG
jgi:TetR/AcrR family transcriptional regulator, transcriptional repressor for nem operon